MFRERRRWVMVLLIMCGLALGPPSRVAAQDPSPEMIEAKQLTERVIELYAAGRYDEAIPLAERALAIREKVLNSEHPDLAASLYNLANLYRVTGDYERAEPLLQRSLSIREKTFGLDDIDVGESLNALGLLFTEKGDYARAEPLYQRALEIVEKALGTKNPLLAIPLNNLGGVYQAKGDYTRAESLYQRALSISEKTLSAEHPDVVALSLNNLATLYVRKADYARAELMYQRALTLWGDALGNEHPEVATALNNLGALYQTKGDYARAEPMYRRALEIVEKANGVDHPDVALLLNNLGLLYKTKRDYARAEVTYRRALAIREKAFGAEHPDVAASLYSLAALYETKNDYVRAVQFHQRAEDVQELNLSLILSTGSEGQKQLYLNTLTGETSAAVSLHARSAPGDQQAAHLAVTTILRRKGRALDAMTDQINALRQRAAPEDKQLLDQLAIAQSQLAKLRLSDGNTNDPRTPEERKAEAERLTTEIENLQAGISRRSAEFRALAQPVTFEAVQQALPADAALVELFSYAPFNAKATKDAERFGAPRYVAYVLKPKGAVTFVDLGPAEAIDRAAEGFLDAISNPASADAKETGRALDEMVARPVRKLLGDVRNVLISPDGKLNLVPFAALVDEGGKYLVENYTITYLTSGRDLLRLNVPRQSKQTPVVIANPAFNAAITSASPGTAPTAAGNRAAANQTGSQTRQAPARSRGRRSGNMFRANWSELRGTAEEADYLKRLLPNARVHTGRDATESALKQVAAHPPPRHARLLSPGSAARCERQSENSWRESAAALRAGAGRRE